MTSEEPVRRVGDRQYVGEGITVFWEPALCLHTGNCTLHQAGVFNPKQRPWVNITAATADEIAEAIQHCPSGALRYERTDGTLQEPVPETVQVESQPNGPLYLRGNLQIKDAEGQVLRQASRVALCRCGRSDNKPFCDNTHRRIGFKDPV